MSAHRIQDERTGDVVRLVGRGVLATSAALTLTGAGAGLAVATPGHGHGHGDDHGANASDRHGADSGHDADCRPMGDEIVSGVLGDLGLGGSDAGDPEDASCDSSSSVGSEGTSGSDSGTQQAAAQRVAVPSNPDDIAPAPGETKVLDIPDRSAS